jgi:hypothetical protein
MAYELVGTPKTEKVTKALAMKFRDMDPVPNDRQLKPKRLDAYRKMLHAGLFRPVQWATVHCHETGMTYRANGKHTSTLFCEYEALPQDVYATIEHYHCDDLNDVARLYATFDSRTQVRTTNDINRAFAAVDPELSDISPSIINLCVSSVSYSRYREQYTTMPAPERAECLLEADVKRFVQWVDSLSLRSDSALHLSRSPVVACMFDTWSKCRRDANEFWLAVKDGSGSNHKSPDRVLHKYLLTVGVFKPGATGVRKRKLATPREMYVKCLHAWNAWRRDTMTDLKYHAQAKIPAAV